MSWDTTALPILRVLIGDDESPYTYCDERLLNILIVSARMVVSELSFDTTYTVTIDTLTISPDPSSDTYFLPLVCLHAAVRVANSEYKASALSAISITDGPSNISMAGGATAMKARLDALKNDYAQAKMQYSVGSGANCASILSTLESIYRDSYVDGTFNPNNYSSYSPYYP